MSALYHSLHQDFSQRATNLQAATLQVEETRRYFERQMKFYKEELKRLDFKGEELRGETGNEI